VGTVRVDEVVNGQNPNLEDERLNLVKGFDVLVSKFSWPVVGVWNGLGKQKFEEVVAVSQEDWKSAWTD
jgi:hypothetical protein